MKYFLGFIWFCLCLSPLYSQDTIYIENKDITDGPVSNNLYGSFWEMGFGRSDLLWGELLFNRSFENTKPISASNSWFTSYCPDINKAYWWHTGYEEPKWYLWSNGRKLDILPLVFNEYWPSAHGKYYMELDTRDKTENILLVQDRIYLKKGKKYDVSGLFSTGNYLSEEKYSSHTVPLTIIICKEGNFQSQISSVKLEVNTNQFNLYHVSLPSVDYEGWCSFVLEVPVGYKLGIDLLSLMPTDVKNGWRSEAIKRIRQELHPKIIRMPGGCFASLYNWRDGIGPREERPVSYDTWWGCELLNDVGTFEMIDLCREIGAEPLFCVPVMFNNEYNAADWVDFCNNPENEQRKAYGRVKPLNVKYWELENEPYRRFDAITYAKRCVSFAKAMKAKDPTIQIAVGNYWLFNKKFAEILDIVGPYVELITNRGGTISEMQHDISLLNQYNKTHGTNIRLCHTEFRPPVSRQNVETDGLNKKVQVEETLFNASIRWKFAMNMVEQYIAYQNMGRNFFTATFTNLSDGWGECLINLPKETTYLSATGVAFSLLNSLDLVYPQKVKRALEDENLVIQAAWNAERNKMTLLLLNFNMINKRVSIDCSDINKQLQFIKGIKISPKSGMSFNSSQHPQDIKMVNFTDYSSSFIIPAMSLVAIEFLAS